MKADVPTTLVELFRRRSADSRDAIALHTPNSGRFERRAWGQIAADVSRWAAALKELGVRPGDRVIQIAENRYEWIIADLAIHLARGVHVAVHAALSGAQMAFQILDTEARIVLLAGEHIAGQLQSAGVNWPREVKFFSYDACDTQISGRSVQKWDHAVTQGRSDYETWAAEAVEQTAGDDLATILYSSGTTGEPKGVMLSHYNLVSNALGCDALFLPGESDMRVCWLPLSHIFARTCDLYCWIARGKELVLAESRDTIVANCQQFRPTIINGVPYFYDKVHRLCVSQGGSEAAQTERLRALFGGRLQMACSGGAPLADATAEYYCRHGVPLMQGYGLTESSPVISVSTPRSVRTGAVGRPIEGVEVKIAADGEILTRGPHVMFGYWRKPEQTAEAIDPDGWLRTGDLGRLDDDGFLWITGRKKELIVTAGGKNIAPAYLERLLTEDDLILQALIIGDKRNYLSALIVPNAAALQCEIEKRGISLSSPDEAAVHPQVRALYRERIDSRLSNVSHCEQIGEFTLLNRGFTVEDDELTPTLKLRRSVIQQHFAPQIEDMYANETRGASIIG